MDAELIQLLATWTLYFMAYGLVGYLFEVIYCSLQAGEFKNRGFLYGPIVPIYAIGSLLIILVTSWLDWPWWANVLVAIVICDTLEYFTSVLLEKVFHMRWWDYTNNTRWNLNGRISVETSIGFGAGSLVVIYVLHPMLVNLVGMLSSSVAVALAALLFGIYLMDTILSIIAAFKVKGMLDGGHIDLTAQIKKFAAHYYEDARKERQKRWQKRIRKLEKKLGKDARK